MCAIKMLCLLFILLPQLASGQLFLDNASFEGNPEDATTPVGWHGCAPGTTPDILPGPWGVFEEASDGQTFVGLITRLDGTYESIGQRLKKPILSNECYQFKLDLAKSITYNGYSNPLKLRIWGGTSRCGKDQLIFESELIQDSEWSTNYISFTATKNINYLVLEAFHQDEPTPYQGNLLIDHISPIKKCDRARLVENRQDLWSKINEY